MSDKDTKSGGKSGDDKPKAPAPRTGHVAPADPALTEWLERLWTRGNPPERLEVWRMVGSSRDVRRAMVFYENFRPDDKLGIERCAKLGGEILIACQNDCDCAEKRSLYEIAILDSYQQAQPLLRRLGPLVPQRGYAGVGPDGEPRGRADEDDEDDASLGIKPITHKYLSKMVRALERMMAQTHAVIGDTMQLQQAIITSQQSHVERLQNGNIALHNEMQNAADRSLDREVVREREKMKLKVIGSGVKVGENLLYGWFGVPGDEGGTGSGGNGTAPVRRHAGSREQRLAESFLSECRDEKLSVQLFGDWKDPENLTLPDVLAGLGLETPGIFTPQQFGIFIGVSGGLLPPEALDALLPESGKPQEITEEQMVQALPLLTQSMGVALQQLKQIRDEKKETLAQQKGQKQNAPQNGERK